MCDLHRRWVGFRWALVWLLGIVLLPLGQAQERPRIALVLAGGGAAGIAHVGVIRELEALGLRPDCIVGTSMGAIVGGIYATGYSGPELENIVGGIDWTSILNDDSDRSITHPVRRDSRIDPFSTSAQLPIGFDKNGQVQLTAGLVSGVKLSLVLRELTTPAAAIQDFDDLPIPFRAVATDLTTGDPVILADGDLALALRASMSIPALFPPVERQGQILVDGGIVNNLPIDIARDLCGDVIIAVDLPAIDPDPATLKTATGTLLQTITLVIQRQAKANIATLTEDDILLVPAVADIGVLGFPRALEAIVEGKQEVAAHRGRLEALAQRRGGGATPEGTPLPSTIRYSRIEVVNETALADTVILARLGLPPAGEVPVEVLHRRLRRVYGLEAFDNVNYRVFADADGEPVLEVTAQALSTGTVELRAGLALQDDFEGQGNFTLSLGVSLTQLNPLGARVDADGALGETTGLRLRFEQPLDTAQTWFFRTQAFYFENNAALFPQPNDQLAEFRIQEAEAGVSVLWAPGNWGRVGLGPAFNLARAELTIGDDQLLDELNIEERWHRNLRIQALLDYDTLDDPDLPRQGEELAVVLAVNPDPGSDERGEVVADALLARSFGAHTLALFGRVDAELAVDEDLNPHFLGGFQQLSGFSQDEILGNVALLGGLRYYRRFALAALFSREAFVGASVEYGNVWADWGAVDPLDGLFHGAIFAGTETNFGPLFLGFGAGEGGEYAGHLGLGYRF